MFNLFFFFKLVNYKLYNEYHYANHVYLSTYCIFTRHDGWNEYVYYIFIITFSTLNNIIIINYYH
jgi:hypothetical protein